MHSSRLLLEEPIRMASILEPSKPSFFPAMTKIVGTLGPKSRSVDVISSCLKTGMSVARFDFSWGDIAYHQETLDNLKIAIKSTKKFCAVMLDTVGAELQVVNKGGQPISLEADASVVLTPDQGQEASSELLPINFGGLAKAVKQGDTIFIGQYLFTGSETTSAWLEVAEVKGEDVVCVIKNTATLAGALFTLHASQIHIDLPTLSDADKDVISKWGVQNNIDFLSLSYTRHAEDVRHARDFLSKLGDLHQTHIFAKIENVEGLAHFDEILQEADGIILSRGNLGIDLPPEKVFLFQKAAVYKCNMAGKAAVVTRVVDSMTDNLRPTRAEATDEAVRLYEEIYKKKFNLRHCWVILRHEQKWIDKLRSISDGKGKGKSDYSSSGSAASPIDLNAGPDMPAAFNERPMGTHTAKRKAKTKAKETDEGFNFTKAMDQIKERREISRKRHEQEKKEQFERKMRAAEETRKLNRMEWEHKILSMDLSAMEPAKANYYRKRQEEILQAFQD